MRKKINNPEPPDIKLKPPPPPPPPPKRIIREDVRFFWIREKDEK